MADGASLGESLLRTSVSGPSRAATARKGSRPGLSWLQGLAGLAGAVGPGTVERALFYRSFATMVESGVEIPRALAVLARQAQNPLLARALADCLVRVGQGQRLSQAMALHPTVFPRTDCQIVRIGEESGTFHWVVPRLADFTEKSGAAARKVVQSLLYPGFVLAFCLGLLAIAPATTLAGLLDMLREFNVELPWTTRFLTGLSQLLRSPFLIVLALAVPFALARLRDLWRQSPFLRRRVQGLLARFPGLGRVLGYAAVADVARSLSLMLDVGMPLLKAMDLAEGCTGNLVVQDAVRLARAELTRGARFHEALAASRVFPPMMVRMIAAGEESGSVTRMLDKVARLCDQAVDEALELAAATLQPVILLLLGMVVGFYMIASLSPLLKVMESL